MSVVVRKDGLIMRVKMISVLVRVPRVQGEGRSMEVVIFR